MENIKKFNFYRLNIVKCYIDPYLNHIESFHQIYYIDIIFKFIILALFYTRVHKFLTDHNIMIIYDEYKCLSKWKIIISRNNIISRLIKFYFLFEEHWNVLIQSNIKSEMLKNSNYRVDAFSTSLSLYGFQQIFVGIHKKRGVYLPGNWNLKKIEL